MQLEFRTKPFLQSVRRTLLVFLAGMALSGVLYGPETATRSLKMLGIAIPILGLGAWLCILVHELGHYWAAKKFGLNIAVFKVGPFVWKTEQVEKINDLIDGAGGLVMPVYTDWSRVREQVRSIVTAGPLASLVLAVLLSLGARAAPTRVSEMTWPQASLVIGFWGVVIVSWLLVTNILPFKYSGLYSDGYQLLALKRGGTEADQLAALAFISSLSVQGRRARNWPPEPILALTAAARGDEREAMAQYLLYAHYRDSGQIALARQSVDRAVSLIPSVSPKNIVLRQAIWTEAAFMAEDAVQGRQFLDLVGPPLVNIALWTLRAEAHVLSLEGDMEGARDRIQKFLNQAQHDLRFSPERLESARESVQDLASQEM